MAPSTSSTINIYADHEQAADVAPEYSPNSSQFLSHLVNQLLDAESAHTLCDVMLRTSDGHNVPACRALLAASSDYFRSLFFSNFEEATQKTVQLNISKLVLRQILHFAYAGYCPFLKRMVRAASSSSSKIFPNHDELPTLVQLTAAAEYHGLMLLHTWCEAALLNICRKFLASSCAVLQAMNQKCPSHPATTAIFKIVRKKCRIAFNLRESEQSRSSSSEDSSLDSEDDSSSATSADTQVQPHGILDLSPSALVTLYDGYIRSDLHEYFFQGIFLWVTNGTTLKYGYKLRTSSTGAGANGSDSYREDGQNDDDEEQNIVSVDSERMEWGKLCAAKLNLRCMRIRFVHDYVIPTGLIEDVDFTEMLWDHVMSTTKFIRVKN